MTDPAHPETDPTGPDTPTGNPDNPAEDPEAPEGTEDTTETETEAESGAEGTEPSIASPEVRKLRRQAGNYRTQLRDSEQRVDDLEQRLHTALVAATGRLADPADLELDTDHLDDPEALAAAVDDLVKAKPHLARRTPTGDVGQGQGTAPTVSTDLAGILRGRA